MQKCKTLQLCVLKLFAARDAGILNLKLMHLRICTLTP